MAGLSGVASFANVKHEHELLSFMRGNNEEKRSQDVRIQSIAVLDYLHC